ADLTWEIFVEKISLLQGTRNQGSVQSFSSRKYYSEVSSIFSRRIEASKIDRKRLEAITKRVLDRSKQQYAGKLGQQLLVYRGRGGTGKTVRLIQTAYQAYDESGMRVLLLTYNKALVSDLRRLLALLGIQDAIGEGSIAVKTIHSFMHEWLVSLGVIRQGQSDFIANYEKYKEEALVLLRGGALDSSDFARAKATHSRSLSWDLVLIDESQDWPSDERDILYSLYGYKKIIIADGVDQFVRGVSRIDWREGLSSSDSQVVSLTKSLRLKSTLCEAVGHFAGLIEFDNWNLVPEPEAHGGKVIVVEGNVFSSEFHRRLADSAKADGNRPIDMLLCVPPTWVRKNGERRESVVAEKYREWGHKVWDGVDSEERSDFPTSLDQFRIVQYESCRGLEGWVVVNFGFDEFFEYKNSNAEFSDGQKQDMFFEEESASLEYAKKWLMIPLTRAIDTLVLHIKNPNSYAGRALSQLRDKYPDEVEWVKISE
ncbi:MAG: AAA family ATPase, partial [Nitrososphaera sp.]|nr:AAA family ATPase [Nitrososphaera sp.]